MPGFTVGGSVGGLAGSGLVLQNNAGDDVAVSADGAFAFATPIADGAGYAVTVKTQPTNLSQSCTVGSGAGTIAGANVTNVTVTCVTNTFTVGGTVGGLVGTGLVLQNGGADDLAVGNDGPFVFSTPQVDGTGFAVTVKAQPTGPMQTCSVIDGAGTLAGANVTNVAVSCVTNTYTIGGNVNGLGGGESVFLKNNGGDELEIAADGAFTFVTPIASGATYAVTVSTPPGGKVCQVTSGSGTVVASNVGDVSVACMPASQTFTLTSSSVNNLYTGCNHVPPEIRFGGLATSPGPSGRLEWTDAVGLVPQSITLDVSLGWTCGTAGNHNVYLNDVLVGTIATSTLGCTCTLGPVIRTLAFSTLVSFAPNGLNTVRIDTIPDTGNYTIAANPAWSNAYGQVTLGY